MGEEHFFQPLTTADKITTIIYRLGIFLSTVIISISALLAMNFIPGSNSQNQSIILSGFSPFMLLLMLYFSVGLSVFFIHLYVGRYYRTLKKIYYVALVCLALLFIIGKGNPAVPLLEAPPYSALLLIPLSLCLGFVTAKEAFCFRLYEGYLLLLIMPPYIFLCSTGAFSQRAAAFGLAFIAAMLVFFTLRKVFMPIHYDIGDKSAYQP
jgi:uncharacterized integral membrane protein